MEALRVQTEKLLKDGKADEAKQLLFDALSGPDPAPEARDLFDQTFPLTAEQVAWTKETVEPLASPNAALRGKAAQRLSRRACSSVTLQMRDSIADPRILDRVIPLLNSNDEKVREAAIIAIARAAQFFIRDAKALPAIEQAVEDRTQRVRRWAVEAYGHLAGQAGLDRLVGLLADPDDNVAGAAFMTFSSVHARTGTTPALRKTLIRKLAGLLPAKAPNTNSRAINAMRVLNDPAAIPELEAKRHALKGVQLGKLVDHAVRCLNARDPLLPYK